MAYKTERELTWSQFLEAAKLEPVTEHNQSRTGGAWFTGTESFTEAMRLAESGWTDGRESLNAAIAKANGIDKAELDPAPAYDVVGYYPDVPLYCAGDPFNMVCHEPEPVKPVIRIAATAKASQSTRASVYLNYGAALVSYIELLEKAGYRVELNLIMQTTDGAYSYRAMVRVKDADESLEIDRLAFALMHRSTQRRLWFSLLEQEAELINYLGHSYGYSTCPKAADPFLHGCYLIDGISNDSPIKHEMRELGSAVLCIGKIVEHVLESLNFANA